MGCKISRKELRRRVWHISPGFLPVALWFVPHKDPLGWWGWLILLAMTVLFGVHGFVRYQRIARPGDRERLSSVVGYGGSVLLCLLLFPGDVEIGLSVLAIIAFGDGSATLGGLTQRGPTLRWNQQKTWYGFACFLAAAVPATSLVHWGETAFNPRSVPETVPFSISLACTGAAGVLAAIAESLPSKINDNVRVGLTAAVAVSLLHGLLVGWHG